MCKTLLLSSDLVHVIYLASQAIRFMSPGPDLRAFMLVLPFIVLLQQIVPVRIVRAEQWLRLPLRRPIERSTVEGARPLHRLPRVVRIAVLEHVVLHAHSYLARHFLPCLKHEFLSCTDSIREVLLDAEQNQILGIERRNRSTRPKFTITVNR